MTYCIEQLRTTVYEDGITSTWWDTVEWFDDKELAEKELRNLNRAWVASGTFRLVEDG